MSGLVHVSGGVVLPINLEQVMGNNGQKKQIIREREREIMGEIVGEIIMEEKKVDGMKIVRVTKKEVVAAVLPMQEHWLPLSNLDLLLPPVDVGVFFCYKKPTYDSTATTLFGSMVGTLKKAMAQALVSYYVFAGEVVPNSIGEPELLCNNRGVDFVEAVADLELKDLDFYNPDLHFEGQLVPHKTHGVLAVQATNLKCGGMVVACTFDHRVADAFSFNMFLVSWAETARSEPTSIVPTFRRSLLNPRRPAMIDPSLDDMYVPISSLPPPNPAAKTHLASRIYYVPAAQLDSLQSLAAASSASKRTKLESFSAFMWQTMAQYEDKNVNNKNLMAKMGIVVDGRTGLGGDNMSAYFGNVLSIPYGQSMIRELAEKPLSCVAEEVHGFLTGAVTGDHFLGLIDWVEARRPEPALAKIYATGSDDGPAFVVSSGQRFPESRVDFGWGRPVIGSYHFPWEATAGYVMPMPSPVGNGDWVVYMHLFPQHLEFIETRAGNVFKPLTWDYLNN